jgi:hypothetical protein
VAAGEKRDAPALRRGWCRHSSHRRAEPFRTSSSARQRPPRGLGQQLHIGSDQPLWDDLARASIRLGSYESRQRPRIRVEQRSPSDPERSTTPCCGPAQPQSDRCGPERPDSRYARARRDGPGPPCPLLAQHSARLSHRAAQELPTRLPVRSHTSHMYPEERRCGGVRTPRWRPLRSSKVRSEGSRYKARMPITSSPSLSRLRRRAPRRTPRRCPFYTSRSPAWPSRATLQSPPAEARGSSCQPS